MGELPRVRSGKSFIFPPLLLNTVCPSLDLSDRSGSPPDFFWVFESIGSVKAITKQITTPQSTRNLQSIHPIPNFSFLTGSGLAGDSTARAGSGGWGGGAQGLFLSVLDASPSLLLQEKA